MSTNTAAYQQAYRDANPTYVDRDRVLKALRRRAMQLVANAHPEAWLAVLKDCPTSWSIDRKYGRLISSYRSEYEVHYAALRAKEGLD